MCGLFSPLESSYLGLSVGGELRCVKWGEEKPFYWLINQICEECVCVWWGGIGGWRNIIVVTPTGANDEDETLKKGLLMASRFHFHILTRFTASGTECPPSRFRSQILQFSTVKRSFWLWKYLLSRREHSNCWSRSGKYFFYGLLELGATCEH